MRASNFYSVEVVEASARFPRRIRVKNRGTGSVYYYPYGKNKCYHHDVHMESRILDIYKSIPYLRPRILWYDPDLKALFFELIPKDNHGNS